MWKLFYTFIVRFIFKKPVRWLLSFLSIVLGVSLYVSISLINGAVLDVFSKNLEAITGRAQISITGGQRGLNESLLRQVEDAPGVYSAAPILETQAIARIPGKPDRVLMISAVDLLRESNFRDYDAENEEVMADPLEFFNQTDSVIVTREFADKTELKLEGRFDIVGVDGTKSLVVRGILKPTGAALAYGGSLALMDIYGAQLVFGKPHLLDRIDVIVDEGQKVEDLISRLKEQLGPGLDVQRSSTRSQETENMIRGFQRFLTLVSSLAWVMGLYFVFNSIVISVAQRRSEIGILRAMGASRATVLFLFEFEALTMGVMGALLGTLLGERLSQKMVVNVAQTLAAQFQTQIQAPEVGLDGGVFVSTLITSVLATFFAALWPSYKATRVQPLEAIRTVQVDGGLVRGLKTNWAIIWGFVLSLLTWFLITKGSPDKNGFSATIIFLSALLIGFVFTIWTAPVFLRKLGEVFQRRGWIILKLSIQSLERSGKIFYSNLAALFLSLFFFLFFSNIDSAFRHTTKKFMIYTNYWDFIVTSPGDLFSYLQQPMRESLIQEVRDSLQLRFGGGAEYSFARGITQKYENIKIRIIGFSEPESYDPPEKTIQVKSGPAEETLRQLFSSQAPTALVSEAFVRNFDVSVGERIELASPSGPQRYQVLGIFEDMSSMNGTVLLPYKEYSEKWKDETIEFLDIGLPSGMDSVSVASFLEDQILGPKGLLLVRQSDLAKDFQKRLDEAFAFTTPVKYTGLFVGLLTLLSTFTVRILSRMKELGVLRAIGMTRWGLAQYLLGEVILQGGIAGFYTLLVGVPSLYLFSKFALVHVVGWQLYPDIPWLDTGLVFILGIIIAIAAGIYPATRAMKLEVSEIIQNE